MDPTTHPPSNFDDQTMAIIIAYEANLADYTPKPNGKGKQPETELSFTDEEFATQLQQEELGYTSTSKGKQLADEQFVFQLQREFARVDSASSKRKHEATDLSDEESIAKRSSPKGKQRETELTDEEFAFQLQREEYAGSKASSSSTSKGKQREIGIPVEDSIGESSTSKGNQRGTEPGDADIARSEAANSSNSKQKEVEKEPIGERETALTDEEYAIQLQQEEFAESQLIMETIFSDERLARDLQAVKPQLPACTACTNDYKSQDMVRFACGHNYCRPCLVHMFEAATYDESSYPPRCCQPILSKDVERSLPAEVLQRFEKKKIEFDTPNRTYCFSPQCSIFIEARHIDGDTATCPRCRTITCTICKGRSHEGEDCPNDESIQKTLELSKKKGWKRCPSCKRMVERISGCRHMTCRCGARFDYLRG